MKWYLKKYENLTPQHISKYKKEKAESIFIP